MRRTKIGRVQDVLVEYDDTGTECNPGRDVHCRMEGGRVWLGALLHGRVDGGQHWLGGVASSVERRADLFV